MPTAQEQIKRAFQRARILRTIERRPVSGFTCDQIEAKLGMLHQTVSARLSELKQAGELIETRSFRETRTGCRARVLLPMKQNRVGRPRK